MKKFSLNLLIKGVEMLTGIKKGLKPFKALKTENLRNGNILKVNDPNDPMTKVEFYSLLMTAFIALFVLMLLVCTFILVVTGKMPYDAFIKIINKLLFFVGIKV